MRRCTDDEWWTKGLGVYSLRYMCAGECIGLYWGECLTRRQLCVRHGWYAPRPWQPQLRLAEAEQEDHDRRRDRLARLIPRHTERGAPIGGSDNDGAYVFEIVERIRKAEPGCVVCIDAEDATRSVRSSPHVF